ncbi:MAG TPA: hypothetical protein VLG37_03555 [Candidatus Saccharimonadales bacterium]|nr:hypothetical protein [Candidatus Saccharimonadales bacterium]
MERKQQNWLKKHKVATFASIALIVIISLAVGVALLASSRHSSVSKKQVASQATTTQYKLAACKSGATETVANASYLVGTDIASGSYKIVSQPAGIDWTNINIYSSKADYIKQGSPSAEQGNPSTSLSPQNNVPTYTKLSNGEFMQVDADPAIFSCE